MTDRLDIRCPRCGARAGFDEPFEFIGASGLSKAQHEALQEAGLARWGSWYVREKFPSVARWKAPPGPATYLWSGPDNPFRLAGYRRWHVGAVRCPACHFVGRHELDRERDLYFQWEHRGVPLWAETAGEARMLLHYIESTDRDPGRYPNGYGKTLRKLPAAIKSAKARPAVAAKIRRTLERAGIAPAGPDEYGR